MNEAYYIEMLRREREKRREAESDLRIANAANFTFGLILIALFVITSMGGM